VEPFLRFGLNLLLWWLVGALSFVLLVAASLFGFFLHLSEFLPLFGRKDSPNLRPRSLVDLLHLFSLLILSQRYVFAHRSHLFELAGQNWLQLFLLILR
jgi:hypothetical protein